MRQGGKSPWEAWRKETEIGIHQIEGIRIGQARDEQGATGCTVILCPKGAVTGVDVRGSAPAGRETETIKPGNVCDVAHAVVLSGGSAFGLDAASGVMEYLEEQGIGFDVGLTRVPIVCGASLFDLTVGSHKARPDKAMGKRACLDAVPGKEILQGNHGAGTGASIGKLLGETYMMKSGLGACCFQLGELKVGAVVAVNALGDVFDLDTGEQIGGLLSEDGKSLRLTEPLMYERYGKDKNYFTANTNTTIGCVITNAVLDQAQAGKVAGIAHDGMARTIAPVHTWADGDTIFTMATGEVKGDPNAVGTLAARAMGYAINRAVREASAAYGLVCAGELEK